MNSHRVPTKEELLLKQELESLGVRVLSQVPDGHKHIDLAIPDARINIEVDGPQHWMNAHQIVSDLERSHGSDDLGYYTIHISNDHINSDARKIAKALAKATEIRIEKFKRT
jgi:very-short-patch-repair endonuclease